MMRAREHLPRLRSADEQRVERTVGWPELIYDLVYVAAIAELAHLLQGAAGWPDVARLALLFVPVLWVWQSATLFADRYALGPVAERAIVFAELIPAATLALVVGKATETRADMFALAFVAARLITVALRAAGRAATPGAASIETRLIAWSTLGLALWLASLAVPSPARYVLWAAGLAIDIAATLPLLPRRHDLPPLSPSHMGERYRLLSIVVLGELIAAAMHGAVGNNRFPVLAGGLGLLLAFALGWSIFDGPLGRPPLEQRTLFVGALMLPLVAGLAAVGAALGDVVATTDSSLRDLDRWLVCGGAALALVSLAALEFGVAQPGGAPPARLLLARVVAAAAMLAVAIFGIATRPGSLLALLAIVALVQTWFTIVATQRPASPEESGAPPGAAAPPDRSAATAGGEV